MRVALEQGWSWSRAVGTSVNAADKSDQLARLIPNVRPLGVDDCTDEVDGHRTIPRLCGNPKKSLANQFCRDSCPSMIRAGFLDPESRKDLTELARDGSAAHRLARRANALVL